MDLHNIKMTVAGLWVLTALVVGVTIDLSWASRIALLALGTLPPLAMLVLWNDPPQTISESIREARH